MSEAVDEAEESLNRLSKDAKRHDAKLEKLLARLRIDHIGSLAVRGKLLGGAGDAPRDSSVAPVEAWLLALSMLPTILQVRTAGMPRR